MMIRHLIYVFALAAIFLLPKAGIAESVLTNAEFKAEFERVSLLENASPDIAFSEMARLAQAGHPKAQDRMGYYHRFGIGTPVDLEHARIWYRRAVDAGRPYSLAPLARVEVALGNGAAAFDLLVEADRLNMPVATRQLAFAHIDGHLGEHSRPDVGFEMLSPLILSKNAKAAVPLLARYNWRRLPDPAHPTLVSVVEELALKGDPKAAETALVYLTRVEPNEIDRRLALFEVPGQSTVVRSSQEIALAGSIRPSEFWLEANRVLKMTDQNALERAAVVTFRINRNAFYFFLQGELSKLGYDPGPTDGILGPSTIQAIERFCRDRGIWGSCAHGPERIDTVRSLANQLALVRSSLTETP